MLVVYGRRGGIRYSLRIRQLADWIDGESGLESLGSGQVID